MEQQYLNLLNDVLQEGEDRMDRTGTGTRSLFGRQIRCKLEHGFPLITTKFTSFKAILGEILWFVEGSSDERRLAEITYGTRHPAQHTIWTANANASYWKDKAQFPGDLGRVYGVQWRNWTHAVLRGGGDNLSHPDGGTTYFDAKVYVKQVDQLKNIIETIKTDPSSRRMVLTAFNVGEMDQMALPPCHMFAQFHVSTSNKLNCQVYIRSNDLFLGLPFNIASYATLTHMIAQVTGKGLGELIITIGDAHIYHDHFEQVKTQLSRRPNSLPKLIITNPAVTDIDGFKMSDFEIQDYNYHPSIKGKMSV